MNKIAVCSILIAFAVVLVLSERCDTYSDCTQTLCHVNDTHVSCQHKVCTCLSHIACQDVSDCNNAAMCHDKNAHYHCVDLRCLCLKDDSIDHGEQP